MSAAAWRVPANVRTASSFTGDATVLAACLAFIGSVPAFPVLLVWLWRRARDPQLLKPDEETVQRRRRAWALFAGAFATYLALMFMPVKRRPGLMGTYPFRMFLEYFRVRYVYAGGEPLPKGQYLFCLMPHGLYPFGGACAGIPDLANVFFNARSAVASASLWVPMIRQLMGWIGAVPATQASISTVLRAGESLSLLPGGIAEMLRTERMRERLVLSQRKGFVRLALEANVPIVPVYIFGQSTTWDQLPLPSWLEWVSRTLRVSLFVPWGRFGLLLPRKEQLLYAIGSPIDCTCDGQPSAARVDEVHQSFVTAVRDLYDMYKGVYGWQHRELVID